MYVKASIEKVQLTSKRPECTQLPKTAAWDSPLTKDGNSETRCASSAAMLAMISADKGFQCATRENVIMSRKFKAGSRTVKRVIGLLLCLTGALLGPLGLFWESAYCGTPYVS